MLDPGMYPRCDHGALFAAARLPCVMDEQLTWPEFARQAISALLLQWTEQDIIYGDSSGAPASSRVQCKLGKRGTQNQGGNKQPELSPACTWLDAQHDARRGDEFLQSITGATAGVA